MAAIVVHLERWKQRRLQRTVRKTRDAGLRTRSLIILHAAAGKSSGAIAEAIDYDPSAVLKVIHRFLAEGEEGLRDHRADNGQPKVNEALRAILVTLVAGSPQDYGWARPTWTQELLARQLTALVGVRVSDTTVGRMLAERGIRWGTARPTVACPWPSRARQRRLQAIKRRLAMLPAGDEAFYEDEVDIHLNPRIGRDWMLPGTQKEVLTPGQNQKHYLAGALNARTGQVLWVGNGRKNSYLFLLLLRRLREAFPRARKLHVILDNYGIHSSTLVQRALTEEFGGRIVLHFLPPYSPKHNRIERLWRELHANVTRNHRCRALSELLHNVEIFLRRASPYPGTKASLIRTPKRRAA
jgi:transposase